MLRHSKTHHRELGFELRVSKLGHTQRGGAANAFDRILASRLGAAAVEHLIQGRHGVLMRVDHGGLVATPLVQVVGAIKPIDSALVELAQKLAY